MLRLWEKLSQLSSSFHPPEKTHWTSTDLYIKPPGQLVKPNLESSYSKNKQKKVIFSR